MWPQERRNKFGTNVSLCFVHVASNSGEAPIQAYSGKESLGNDPGRSCRPRKLAKPVNTSAFMSTNQRDAGGIISGTDPFRWPAYLSVRTK